MNALMDVNQTQQARGMGNPLEVIRFGCWAESGYGSRISFSLP